MSTIVTNKSDVRFIIEQDDGSFDFSDMVDRVEWASDYDFSSPHYTLVIRLKNGCNLRERSLVTSEDNFWGEYATSVDDNRSY